MKVNPFTTRKSVDNLTGMLTRAQKYRDMILTTPGVMGYWPLQVDGHDKVGTLDLTVAGSLTWGVGDGPFGDGSAHVNNTDGQLRRATTPVAGRTELTMEHWFYIPDTANYKGYTMKVGDASTGIGLGVGTNNDVGTAGRYLTGLVELKNWLNSAVKMRGSGWHYGAMAMSGASILLFLDGRWQEIDNPTPMNAVVGGMGIGCHSSGAAAITVPRFAHAAIYSRILSERELVAHSAA